MTHIQIQGLFYPQKSKCQTLILRQPIHAISQSLSTPHVHLFSLAILALTHQANIHSLCPKSDNTAQREEKPTMAAATMAVVGLGTSSLTSHKKLNLSSGFIRSTAPTRNPMRLAQAKGGKFTCFERDWLRTDLNVIGFGLIGWLAPSSIPAINGNSLTGLFLGSIGPELAHFPTGPAVTSPFWLWMVLWHLGLFLTLTFGQIGFKGRTEGYF